MWWKNLGTPVQSLVFGAAVALAAWLLSPYLGGGQHSNVLRDAAQAQIGARNHFGRGPYDIFGLRPGAQNLPDEGR
jgi:hypothetical protein